MSLISGSFGPTYRSCIVDFSVQGICTAKHKSVAKTAARQTLKLLGSFAMISGGCGPSNAAEAKKQHRNGLHAGQGEFTKIHDFAHIVRKLPNKSEQLRISLRLQRKLIEAQS